VFFKIKDRRELAIPWFEGEGEEVDDSAQDSVEKRISAKLEILQKRYSKAEIFVLSFPKSGRTWVRTVVARYLSSRYNVDEDIEFLHQGDSFRSPCFTHNFYDVYRYIEEPVRLLLQEQLDTRPLVLIVRDPRDVCASYFHHVKQRDKLWLGDALNFSMDSVYGIRRQAAFTDLMLSYFVEHPGPKLLLRYESLLKNPYSGFHSLLSLIDRHPVDTEALLKAIEESVFEKMQSAEIAMSRSGQLEKSVRMGTAGWNNNVNALKVRKGKVGGFVDDFGCLGSIYLTLIPDVIRLRWRMRALLSSLEKR